MLRRIVLSIACLLLLACTPAPKDTANTADLILIGEHIITMDESEIGAVAVIGDRISATGTAEDILDMRGPDTRVVELGNKALLPGFIDSHGHLAVVARLIDYVNVSSPPVGPAGSIRDMQKMLRSAIAENDIAPGQWVVGYGYDESLLEEQRHPTRDDLDAVSTEHPVMLLHVSLHLVAANSDALSQHGIGAATAEPPGGRIRRRPDSLEPNGVLEETAAQPLLLGLLHASSENFADKARRALEDYASYGITTAQDGAAVVPDVVTLRSAAAQSPLPIELVAYYHAMTLNDEQRAGMAAEPYVNGVRVGGAKFILDGSIQGKTGYLSLPYVEPPDGKDADYRAYPMMPADVFQKALDPLLQRNVPLLVHANGDAAIDMMIDAIDVSLNGRDVPDHRSVMIHAQMMREDQLDRVKELGIVPSYYSVHPFFWGDWHRQILGNERASRISPIRSTIERGIPFTIHNDAPVVPPDVMRLIWITVNRETRSGHVLGPDQRATVMEALHAVTQGAAYQYFEEDEKGSITPGKQADLVILGANPLAVDADALKDIPVIETISRGRTVYRDGSQ
ncbi:MAG: amidohydrolase [Gammaproteobacteria bacterium]|nr:amidohydrolase [Gammaproteobacteria bacterium]MDH3480188.1 amidohydrolase [Gammaproteobacteria bacterium]